MHCSRHLAAAIFSVVSSDTALHEHQGLRYFAEKKAKFCGIFKGKCAEKSADFVGFLWGKSQNSRNNRPISRDFSAKKSIFEGFSGANS